MNKNIIVKYSKKVEKEVSKRITKDKDETLKKINERYLYYLNDWNRDLGGTKKFS